jgi:hypothetical protein
MSVNGVAIQILLRDPITICITTYNTIETCIVLLTVECKVASGGYGGSLMTHGRIHGLWPIPFLTALSHVIQPRLYFH